MPARICRGGEVSGTPRSPRSCRRYWRSGRGGRRQGSSIQGWSPPGLVDLVLLQERPQDLEPGDVPGAGVRDVPVTGDLGRVFLVEHRVEDRLSGQPRRPLPPARSLDQGQFLRAGRTPQRHGVAHRCHRLMMPPPRGRRPTGLMPAARQPSFLPPTGRLTRWSLPFSCPVPARPVQAIRELSPSDPTEPKPVTEGGRRRDGNARIAAAMGALGTRDGLQRGRTEWVNLPAEKLARLPEHPAARAGVRPADGSGCALRTEA